MDMHAGRRCTRCGVDYDSDEVPMAFRAQNSVHSVRSLNASRLRTVCRPCEQTDRDQRKAANRWLAKARGAITRHAKTTGIPKDVLKNRYGWDAARIAHDFKRAYENGCGYCSALYASMPNGLANLTIDIINRDDPPEYGINTGMCCDTCNRQKGILSPKDFGTMRHVYRKWMDRQRQDPQDLGFLF